VKEGFVECPGAIDLRRQTWMLCAALCVFICVSST